MKTFDFRKQIKESDLLAIKDIILNDGIIVLPTETVYGIGASIYSDVAINKIFKSKGRPNDNPLIVHVSNKEMLNDIALEIKDIESQLMDLFWPGPLTIILAKKAHISNLVSANLDTIGVRMPKAEITLKVIETGGVPLAAPSANISGRPSGTNVYDIVAELENKVDAIIDGGDTQIGIESTVVRVIDEVIHILRPGAITKEDLEKMGFKVVESKPKAEEKVLSPGVKYKHYAPKAKTVLVYSADNVKMVDKINELVQTENNVVVICSLENKDKYATRTLVISSKDDFDEIAKNLYSTLRKADELNPDLIMIEGVAEKHLGRAIMNRLVKAASNNYIEID